MGDLLLIGYPLLASYRAYRSGHAINNLLIREVLKRPHAFELVTFPNTQDAPLGFSQLTPAW